MKYVPLVCCIIENQGSFESCRTMIHLIVPRIATFLFSLSDIRTKTPTFALPWKCDFMFDVFYALRFFSFLTTNNGKIMTLENLLISCFLSFSLTFVCLCLYVLVSYFSFIGLKVAESGSSGIGQKQALGGELLLQAMS